MIEMDTGSMNRLSGRIPIEANKRRRSKMEAMKTPKVLSASTLVGDKVTNVNGEDLGTVEEIMLDLARGRIAYVVLSFGRVNWMPNNKLFAVPWEALTVSFHDKKVILDVSQETLKSAPGFDRDKWPDLGDFDWLATVYRSYNRDPYWK
jgi:sporulation protein YlmC with PRC-barrel domain